jgi:hypothetical protein
LGYQDRTRGKKGTQKSLTTIAVDVERATHPDPANDNASGKNRESSEENWSTPNTMDHLDPRPEEGVVKQATGARKGRTKPANLREQVDEKTCQIYKEVNEENWPTPRAGNPGSRKPGTGGKILAEEAKKNTWATPQVTDGDRINQVRKTEELSEKAKKGGCRNLREDVHNEKRTCPTPQAKLNPNWVEQLMLGKDGVGWTQLPTEWID